MLPKNMLPAEFQAGAADLQALCTFHLAFLGRLSPQAAFKNSTAPSSL